MRLEGPKIEAERRERGEVLEERQQAPSHQLGGLGSAVSSPAGFRAEPRPPKGFPLFSALRMASPDAIILLILDHTKILNPFNFESIIVNLVLLYNVFSI